MTASERETQHWGDTVSQSDGGRETNTHTVGEREREGKAGRERPRQKGTESEKQGEAGRKRATERQNKRLKSRGMDLPGVQRSRICLAVLGMQVRPLDGELRSQMPQSN